MFEKRERVALKNEKIDFIGRDCIRAYDIAQLCNYVPLHGVTAL
jgi:hypothetical protein